MIYQDAKKIGTEEFTITPRSGGYSVEGHTVISDGAQSTDLKSRMELDAALKLTSYEFTSSVGSIRLKVDKPLSQLEYSFRGDKQSEDIRFPDDGVVLDTNFFHHYAILLNRIAGKSGTISVRAFVPQELRLGSMTVRSVAANTFEIETASLKATATTDKDGRLIRLAVPDAKVVVER